MSRKGLVYFFEVLGLYLQCGYDLAFAWREVLLTTGGALSDSLRSELQFETPNESVSELLLRLQATFSVPSFRIWFGVLAELYAKGAGLRDPVLSISRFLKREMDRDLEDHFRSLPSKSNICLMIFFLPPTFVLLFLPLLLQLGSAFSLN